MKKSLSILFLSLVALTAAISPLVASTADSTSTILPPLSSAAPKQYIVEDIKVTGVKYLSPELIINSMGIEKGDTIYLPSENISNIINQLWGYRYYSDIKTLVETDGEKASLEFILTERPRVSTWSVSGVTAGEEKTIMERLNLRERTELSDFAIKNSKDIITTFLEEKGYRNSEIKVIQRDDPKLNNFVTVNFDVIKNNKYKIESINIIGNKELPENKLKLAMKKTREKSLINIFKSSKLKREEFEADKILLEDYMQSKGYRDGRVISDSVYVVSDNRIAIDIKVEEGKKYHYRNISWVGNEKQDIEKLNLLLGINKGDTYDKKTLESRLGIGAGGSEAMMNGEINVSTLYQNDGHLAFEIEPVESVVNGDSIDIEIKLNEGKQFTINNVEITGNNRTNDRVIRRELYIRPGELYDQSMIIHSIRQLGSMGHFNAENIQPDIQPVSDGLVDIGFQLEETPSDQFEVSGGWGGGMFVASVGVTFNNISMRKFFDKDAWRPYPAGDNQKLRISVQTNGTYYKSMSMSFVEPWLGGKKPNSLSTSVYFSSESDAYYAWQTSTARFMTIGANVGISKRLSWPDPNFSLMGELSYQAYKLVNWDYFLLTDGVSNTISLSATLFRNSTDQQMYPRRGSEMFLKATVTPPWSLMNDKNYADPNMTDQDRYNWIEYYKITGMARFFIPMLPNNKLVLMTRGEFGYLGNYDDNNPSPFEGFLVGGDGVTGYSLYGIQNVGLRGYENSALTPYASSGQQARAYTKFTAELRYPVILSPQSNVYLLLFGEAGNAYFDWKTYNPFDLKRSLGVGARIYLPVVGMFGLDWGYGFDSVPGSSKRSGNHFHFSIGQQF